jgi:hypothetical protein
VSVHADFLMFDVQMRVCGAFLPANPRGCVRVCKVLAQRLASALICLGVFAHGTKFPRGTTRFGLTCPAANLEFVLAPPLHHNML